MTELTKGANTPVTGLRPVVTVAWDAAPGSPDVDVSALLLTADGKVRSNDDFVFYNQPEHHSGAAAHQGKSSGGTVAQDVLTIDLTAVEGSIDSVVLAASADGGTFGHLTGLTLLVADVGSGWSARFAITDASTETAFVVGELYRRHGAWRLRAVGQGYDTGLAGLATDFGIAVADDTAGTPETITFASTAAGTAPATAPGGIDWLNPPVPAGYEIG